MLPVWQDPGLSLDLATRIKSSARHPRKRSDGSVAIRVGTLETESVQAWLAGAKPYEQRDVYYLL